MTDQPLQPFALPAMFNQLQLSGAITPNIVMVWVLYAVFAFWTIYTLVAIYHWLKYSHASLIAFPAIAAHLFVSFALMSYALSGNVSYFNFLP